MRRKVEAKKNDTSLNSDFNLNLARNIDILETLALYL